MLEFQIEKYQDKFKPQILEVWEASVLATHAFLHPLHFSEIKVFLEHFDFNLLEVYGLFKGNVLIGFVGVEQEKVEMLFVHPNFFGVGAGKKLLDFSITTLNATEVDVNEQNTSAVGFYKKMGFEIYNRTDKDSAGRDYPLLQMRLIISK